MQDLNDKITGSTLTAAEWNEVPSEIQNAITSSGQTLSGSDLQQLVKTISHYAGGGDFYTDSGLVNAYVLDPTNTNVSPPEYKDGQKVRFVAGSANTSSNATIRVGSLPIKPLKLTEGANPSIGDIDGRTEVVFDESNDWFEITNPKVGGSSGGIGVNLLNNSSFDINQRSVIGSVVLAAGQCGHDRWIAGPSGCTYTFAKTNGVTTITITSGTLGQVIEALNLTAGEHVATWQGTSQARIYEAGTLIGGFGDSGITASFVGGVDYSIEFDVGTITTPKLEFGANGSTYLPINPQTDIDNCQRYFEILLDNLYGTQGSNITSAINWQYKSTKRITPILTPVSNAIVVVNGLNHSSVSRGSGTATYSAGSTVDAEYTGL